MARYYVQDSRQTVGNCVLWWRHNGEGYTCNLDDAMIVDEEWVGRDTDIKWPREKIEEHAVTHVDCQSLRSIKREPKPRA